MAVVLQRIVGSARGRPLLSRLRRRRPVAQLLPAAADAGRGRHRGRGARAGRDGRRRRAVRPLLPALPAAHRRVLVGGRDDQQRAARIPRARARRLEQRRTAGAGAVRPAGGRGGRHARAPRLHLLAGERRRVRRDVAPGRAPRHLRAAPQARALSARRAARRAARAWRRRASARRSRSSSPWTSRPIPRGRPSSACCSCGRWRGCASCRTSPSRGSSGAGSSARARSVLGHGTIDDVRDVVVVDVAPVRSATQPRRRRGGGAVQRAACWRSGRRICSSASGGGDRPIRCSAFRSGGIRFRGARAIVEAGFRDFRVTPSQGSHFFQNLRGGRHRLLHRQPGRGRRLRRLGVARGAAGGGGGRVRAPRAARRSRRRDRRRPLARRDHHEAASYVSVRLQPDGTSPLQPDLAAGGANRPIASSESAFIST